MTNFSSPGAALRSVAVCLAALLAVAGCGPATAPAGGTEPEHAPVPARSTRPNVVVFVLDTTRGDRCAVNGYGRPTTPSLDALAATSVVYRDAWAPSCWTAPSHASLFTGLSPLEHGFMNERRLYLPLRFTTLAETLAADGYATGCFTRNPLISREFGLDQGFEEYVPLFLRPGTSHDADEAQRAGADWALAARAAGRPFFLFVNVLEAHAPYAPPEPWGDAFAGDATPAERTWVEAFKVPRSLGWMVGAVSATERQMELVNRIYDGGVAAADAAVGSLVERLRAAGELERTLFVVTSDHGEYLGDHGRMDHVGGVHRAVLHVPLVVRYPHGRGGGRVATDTARLEDVFATVLEECGLPLPSGEGGDAAPLQSLAPGRVARACIGVPDVALRQVEALFPGAPSEPLRHAWSSVYDGGHHLLVRDDGHVELYDVGADPAEARDLAATAPDVVARLRALLGE